MGFQYDSDDLGYEYGYEKPSTISSETKQNFIGEGDSPKVVYQCQNTVTAPVFTVPNPITGNSPDPKVNAQQQVEDARQALAVAQRAFDDADKAMSTSVDSKKQEAYRNAKQGLDRAKAKLEGAERLLQPKTPQPTSAQAGADGAAKFQPPPPRTESSAALASSAKKTDAEIVKEARDSVLRNKKEIPAASADALADGLISTLENLKIEAKMSGPKGGWFKRIVDSGKSTTITYRVNGVDIPGSEIIYDVADGKGVLRGDVPSATKPNPAAKIQELQASAEAALNGKTTTATVKTALEGNGWTVEAGDTKEADGTIKATKEGKQFTFEVKEGKVKIVPPHVSEHTPPKPHSYEQMKDAEGVQQLKLHLGNVEDETFSRWWSTEVQPGLDANPQDLAKILKKKKEEFDTFKANPANKATGAEYIRVKVAFHTITEINEKLGAVETKQTLMARGYNIELTDKGIILKSRKLLDGTERLLNESDLKELVNLNQQVHSSNFRLSKFQEDTARRAALYEYIHAPEIPSENRGAIIEILRGAKYLSDDNSTLYGNPTEFDVQNFKTKMFPGSSAGPVAPTAKSLTPFANIFKDYQSRYQILEDERTGLKSAHQVLRKENRGSGREDADIDREFAVKQAELKEQFDGKIKKALASTDPSTRAYVQEQLKAADYYPGNDLSKKPKGNWNAERFAQGVTAAPFNAILQDYQKATDANEKARQAALSRYPSKEKDAIAAVHQKYDHFAANLKKDLDKKIKDQIVSADSVTLKYITKKLEALSYYKENKSEKGAAEVWSKENQDKFIQETSAPALPHAGIARLPDTSKLERGVKELRKLEEKVRKDVEKHADDPEKVRKSVKEAEEAVADIGKNLDPVSQTLLQNAASEGRSKGWEKQIDARLRKAGFSDLDIKNLKQVWKISGGDGKISPNLQPHMAEAKFLELGDLSVAQGKDLEALKDGVRLREVQSTRDKLSAALTRAGLTPEEKKKYGCEKGYFGDEKTFSAESLASMLKDLDDLEKAEKSLDPKAAMKTLRDRYTEESKDTHVPESGIVGDQATIFGFGSSKEEKAKQQKVKSDREAQKNDLDTKIKAKTAKLEEATTSDKDKEGLRKELKTLQGQRSSLGGRRSDESVEIQREDLQLKKLQAAQNNEQARQKPILEAEATARRNVFTSKEDQKKIEAENMRARLQMMSSFISSLIQAMLSLVAQVFSAQHQTVTAFIQTTHAPRGKGMA